MRPKLKCSTLELILKIDSLKPTIANQISAQTSVKNAKRQRHILNVYWNLLQHIPQPLPNIYILKQLRLKVQYLNHIVMFALDIQNLIKVIVIYRSCNFSKSVDMQYQYSRSLKDHQFFVANSSIACKIIVVLS